MCNWQDIVAIKKGKKRIQKIPLPARVFSDACRIIHQRAQEKRRIYYKDLENELKSFGHRKIYRGTIGDIVGEVSVQVSQLTNPSIYPSAIVVRMDTNRVGVGFWGVDRGTNPPSEVPQNQRQNKLQQYQNDAFNRPWNCNC
jgi:hypothetical protein